MVYRGRLLDSTGNVIDSGAVAVNFKLYDAAAVGNLLYEDYNPAVSVSGGLYRAVVGDDTTDHGNGAATTSLITALQSAAAVYLELEIDGSTMAPREKIEAAPFALVAVQGGGGGGELSEYATVAAAEAASGTDNDLCFVAETEAFYRYEASGGAYTDDNSYVLSTGDGGNTRWLAVAGRYQRLDSNIKTYTYVNGGIGHKIAAWSASHTVTEDDNWIIGDSSSGDITITFPDVTGFSGPAHEWHVAKEDDGDSNAVNVAFSVPAQVVGDVTSLRIASTEAAWKVVGDSVAGEYRLFPLQGAAAIDDLSVTTYQPSTSESDELMMSGYLGALGNNRQASVGFKYREKGSGTWLDSAYRTVSAAGAFTATVSSGIDHTDIYEVKAVAYNEAGDAFEGETLESFNTIYGSIADAEADNLVRAWEFQEDSGTDTPADDSIAGDEMTMANGVAIGSDTVNGRTKYKRIFGTNDYGAAGYQLPSGSAYTVLLWIDYLGDYNDDHTFVNFGANVMGFGANATTTRGIELVVNGNATRGTWQPSGFTFIAVRSNGSNLTELLEVTDSATTQRLSLAAVTNNAGTGVNFGRGAAGDGHQQEAEYLDDGEVRGFYIWSESKNDTFLEGVVEDLEDGYMLVGTEPVSAGSLQGAITKGKIPVATDSSTLVDSIMSQSGGGVSVAGDLDAETMTTDTMTVNDLLNAPASSAPPASPQGGSIYYDTDDDTLKVYNAGTSSWDDLN